MSTGAPDAAQLNRILARIAQQDRPPLSELYDTTAGALLAVALPVLPVQATAM